MAAKRGTRSLRGEMREGLNKGGLQRGAVYILRAATVRKAFSRPESRRGRMSEGWTSHPVSLVISTMSAIAVSGALQAAPRTAAAPTTTNVDLSATPSGEMCETTSPTRAPRNREGANSPPTRPPPTQTCGRATHESKRLPR